MKTEAGSPETYSNKIDRLSYKLSCADTEIKELENKLAIALATRERDNRALDLLEKCCYSESSWTQKEKRDREVSGLVRERLSDLNHELWLQTNQYH